MRPPEVIERPRTKTKEVGKKIGEATSEGLTEGWRKAKGLGKIERFFRMCTGGQKKQDV